MTIGVSLSGTRPSMCASSVAPGDVQRARDGALLVLVGLADVEHDARRPATGRIGLGGVDLVDLGLGGGEQLTEGGHRGWSLVRWSG